MRALGALAMLAAAAATVSPRSVAAARGVVSPVPSTAPAPKPWQREPLPPQFPPPSKTTAAAPAPFSKRAPAPFVVRTPVPWPAPPGCQASSRLGGTILHPGDPAAYDTLIRDTARRHRIDAALVAAIIHTESAFDSHAISPAGAVGLMQLLPTTAQRHGGRDVFAPHENVDAGCRHLRMLLDRYQGNARLALAAYNAGEQRVDVARSVPPIAETRDYVDRVLRYRAAYLARSGSR